MNRDILIKTLLKTMWVGLSFISAFLLGFYDISKKQSLVNNAVIPVLFINTLFCTLILSPLFTISLLSPDTFRDTIFYMPSLDLSGHIKVFIKSIIVLTSWILGFFAVKHLPLTTTGPINATRPILSLVGAILIFDERLNTYQWIGVILTIVSFILLSQSSKKEGISFTKNKWILFMFLSTFLGAMSGLYDKYLMLHLPSTSVQFWFNGYQCLLMLIIMVFLWYPKRKENPFTWTWSILALSVFLSIADFVYFYALTLPGAMISIVSMIRRSSVVVSFGGGALLFKEKNLKGKAFDLFLILVSMFFLYLGSK